MICLVLPVTDVDLALVGVDTNQDDVRSQATDLILVVYLNTLRSHSLFYSNTILTE